MEYVQRKVAKRLGMPRRIKHLLPRASRKLIVKTLIMPLLEYADTVWGDRNNSSLMESLQILQIKAAKLVLDLLKFASSSQALHSLNWNSLKDRRRLHRCAFIFKVFNNLIDFNLKSTRQLQY